MSKTRTGLGFGCSSKNNDERTGILYEKSIDNISCHNTREINEELEQDLVLAATTRMILREQELFAGYLAGVWHRKYLFQDTIPER